MMKKRRHIRSNKSFVKSLVVLRNQVPEKCLSLMLLLLFFFSVLFSSSSYTQAFVSSTLTSLRQKTFDRFFLYKKKEEKILFLILYKLKIKKVQSRAPIKMESCIYAIVFSCKNLQVLIINHRSLCSTLQNMTNEKSKRKKHALN